jgi:hypothetical protein
MLFTKDFLYLENDKAIALKFIESMSYPSGEDLTIAKLKDDLYIEVVMVSGKEYIISVRHQFNELNWGIEGIKAGRESIFDKWCYTLTGK